MDLLTEYLFSLPMIVFTIPMLILAMTWLVTLLGMLDMDVFDFSGDVDADADTGGDWLSTLGLDGVPLMVAVTIVDFFGLAFTYVARKYLMPLLDGIFTGAVMGILVALAALVIAIPIAALCIKPLRRFFVSHEGASKDQLMGTLCIVRTQYVSESFGQAVGDNDMTFSIRAKQPNDLKQGSRVALIDYDSLSDTYTVVSETELRAMSSQPHLS